MALFLVIAHGSRERVTLALQELTVERLLVVETGSTTVLANSPAGVEEQPLSAVGTEWLWMAAADAPGHSVMGGGDSVFATRRFRVRVRVVYAFISAGGMVGFLPRQTLPVVESMRATARR